MTRATFLFTIKARKQPGKFLLMALVISLMAISLIPPAVVKAAALDISPGWSGRNSGNVGEAYSTTFNATGGTTPYSTMTMTGSVPGLTFSGAAGTGTLSGTPTTVGSYALALSVTDKDGTTTQSSTTFDVFAYPSVNITITSAGPGGAVMQGFAVWVNVTVDPPGTQSIMPGGVVSITSGNKNPTCTITLSSSAGKCALFFTDAKSYTLIAAYGGDTYYYAVSNTKNITVQTLSISTMLTAGRHDTCEHLANGNFICWGMPDYIPHDSSVPPNPIEAGPVTSLSAGSYQTCGIQLDGSIICWADDPLITSNIPTGQFLAISSGMNHVCAIDVNNELQCWGSISGDPQLSPPTGQFKAVNAGNLHSCAIRSSNNRVECWGEPSNNRLNHPAATQFKSIGVGANHTCGVTTGGSLACWGTPAAAVAPPTGSNYTRVESGSDYSCAQKTDNTLVCWGISTNVPPVDATSAFTNFSSGYLHTCALKDNGSGGYDLDCWGQNPSGQAPQLAISPTSLTSPYLPRGKSWSQTFTPSGGALPMTITLNSGSLPPGLNLVNGVLSGSPTTLGTFNFTLRVAETFDHSLPLELAPALQAYSLTVENPATSITIQSITSNVPAGSPVVVNVTVNKSGTPGLTGQVIVTTSESDTACQVTLAGGNTASCTLFFENEGDKTVSIHYGGDSFYDASTVVDQVIHMTHVDIAPVLSAGSGYTCSINANGSVSCWGKNDSGQASPPSRILNQISAGENTTCAHSLNGRLYCWGWNGYGMATPSSISGWLNVTVGQEHTCGLFYDGHVECWGNSASGRLSPSSSNFYAISAGDNHTCGVLSNAGGNASCWGDNTYGQLNTPSSIGFNAISSGGTFSCGITTDETLACWGGSGVVDSIRTPPGGTYTSVEAGGSHACAIKTDNTVVCWGSNTYGQASAPTGTFSTITAGKNHTCGLRSDGTMVCWGSNAYDGAPGLSFSPSTLPVIDVDATWTQPIVISGGRTTNFSFNLKSGSLPAGLLLDSTSGTIHGTPTQAGYYNFTVNTVESDRSPALGADKAYSLTVKSKVAVSTGTIVPASRMVGKPVTIPFAISETPGTAMGTSPTGTVTVESSDGLSCQGVLSSGQGSCIIFFRSPGVKTLTVHYPGDGLFLAGDSALAPVSIPVDPFSQPIALWSGLDRTFIHQPDGTLTCLGANCSQGDLNEIYTAVGVGDAMVCALQTDGQVKCKANTLPEDMHTGMYIGLAVGRAHSCAIKVDGTIACWGANDSGQATPVAGTFTSLSAGAHNTCGVRTDETLACWGANGSGQSTPPAGTFLSISVGADHACGVKTGGGLACWGSDSHGQVSGMPVSGNYLSVKAGGTHSCALRSDGQVICWGDISLKQGASPYGTFTALAAYDNHSCALRAGPKLTCWGKDDFGEAPQITVAPIPVAEIIADRFWDHDFNPLGGSKPYVANVVAGTLPPGTPLKTSPAGVMLYGVPKVPGDYNFVLGWEDSSLLPLVMETPYSLRVTGEDLSVKIVPANPLNALTGNNFSFAFVLKNATVLDVPNVAFDVTLPDGLSGVTLSGIAGCVLSGGTIHCSIPSFPGNGTMNLTASGTVSGAVGSMLLTTASIQPTLDNWPELAPGDNTDEVSVQVAYQMVFYTETFDSPPPAVWSGGSKITAPGGTTYLGDFTGNDALRLQLANLAGHKKVIVTFEVYAIGGWTGNTPTGSPHRWDFGLTGQTPLLDTTFSNNPANNQAYPWALPMGSYPAFTNAKAINTLGYPSTTDARYLLTFTIPHTDNSLDLTFSSFNLPGGVRWGLDNVQVVLDSGVNRLFLPGVQKK